jgi:hypothetical protein
MSSFSRYIFESFLVERRIKNLKKIDFSDFSDMF